MPYNIGVYHIDTRGPYPILFIGMRSFRLYSIHHKVTKEQALKLLRWP